MKIPVRGVASDNLLVLFRLIVRNFSLFIAVLCFLIAIVMLSADLNWIENAVHQAAEFCNSQMCNVDHHSLILQFSLTDFSVSSTNDYLLSAIIGKILTVQYVEMFSRIW